MNEDNEITKMVKQTTDKERDPLKGDEIDATELEAIVGGTGQYDLGSGQLTGRRSH
jgi:hypothetical protein